MNSAVCSTLRSRLNLPVIALLLTIPFLTHPAAAQDPGEQMAQQAAQQGQQAAQQAADDAMRATQQAMQNMQDPQDSSTPSYSSSNRQQPPTIPSPNTPVPPQIRSAHSIFIANDGASLNFPLDPDVAYSAFYEALQAWGHYQMASTAHQADLIFELQGITPFNPALQLTIRDPKTNTRLWTVTSPFIVSPKRSKLAYWQEISITNLVSRVKVLAGEPLSSTETADLTTVPNYHTGRAVAIIVGTTIGVGVGGGLLLHHEFENGLANQKASQDAFCTANNIPLSECAGG